jgi:hypothetical protein
VRHPLSNESLRDWLKQQPSTREYDYSNSLNCPLCLYLRSMGFDVKFVTADNWGDHRGNLHDLPADWNWAVNSPAGTWADAADRMDKVIAKHEAYAKARLSVLA